MYFASEKKKIMFFSREAYFDICKISNREYAVTVKYVSTRQNGDTSIVVSRCR